MTINIKYNHNIKMFEFENVYPQKLPLDINLPENKGGLSKEEEDLLNMNLEYIKKNTWLWDIKDKNYTFNLPPTIFQNKIVISTSYQYEGGNRVVGMKSRGVYETPGGTILMSAHEQLEELILDRETMETKKKLGSQFAQIVYEGKWFTPLREAIQAFVTSTQEYVTGEVKFKLCLDLHFVSCKNMT